MIMGCSDYSINGGSFNTGWTPEDIPDDPVTPTPTPETAEKAPLYWTVYEYGRLAERERNGLQYAERDLAEKYRLGG